MIRVYLSFVLMVGSCAVALAQESYKPAPTDLTFKLKNLRINCLKSDNDEDIERLNAQFRLTLLQALQNDQEFITDSIPSFGNVKSPDKKLELYTWNILKEFEEYEYFAFLKFKNGEVIELKDKSRILLTPELKITSTNNWFGALYFDIIPVKNDKKQKYYVLLGWDGNTGSSIKKVIDVLYFDERLENWQLGKKIFGPPFRDITRFFLEYSGEVNASLKYHKKENQIIFDHLVPLNTGLEGVFEFYVPDLSFDGFEFRSDYWYFIQNVDVRGNQTMENYTTPKTDIRLE